MTLEEFDEGLLKWGAALSRWPSTEQSAARALLDTDKTARALLEEMGSFETGLGAAMTVDVNAGAVSARVQTAIHDRADQPRLLSLLPLWRMLGLGSLAGVGGAAFAMILPASVDSGRFLTMALGGGVL
jgi:hypothetical protein